ncbi:MAG: CCA tRNA nucleotidyltransferase [Acidobacteria bacterium]|nr:CCA tRNA nucleotidyltransferase [Acidobacteriota bacterium]
MIGDGARDLALKIARTIRKAGFQAYLVGGCVRDMILNRTPKDFDIATDAIPGDILRLFPGAILVGAQFGVVLVRENGVQVEIATFRSDFAYEDGRRPRQVAFENDPKQDVLRRDFTINALLYDIENDTVIDFVNGKRDVFEGIVRAIGDPERRFGEDHLRMLRAVRFAARLGFSIEPGTMAAIQKLHASIGRVSAERVRDELTRILTEGGARRGLELLEESRLLGDVLPEVRALREVEQPPEFHPEGDVWTHTLMMLDGLRPPVTTELAWGVLLHDIGKPGTFRRAPDRIRFDGHVELGLELARGILGRLRFSNEETERVLALIANHMRFMDAPRMRESTLKRFLRMERFDEHLELHRLDCQSSNGNLTTYDFARERLGALAPEQLKPTRLIDGADLIALGYRPGPLFKQMLGAVEDAQLEGSVATRDTAIEFVKNRFGTP